MFCDFRQKIHALVSSNSAHNPGYPGVNWMVYVDEMGRKTAR